VAVETVRHFIREEPALHEVIFACFSASDLETYQALLRRDG
jgi:O-acetyl-ADP-ribose deacetylase (regulator of RNase III)